MADHPADLRPRPAGKPISGEADYRRALAEVESLMRAEKDTPEGARLDELVTAIEAYEAEHYVSDWFLARR